MQVVAIYFIAIHTSAIQSKNGAKLAREYVVNGGRIFAYSSNKTEFISAHKGKSVSAFYADYYDTDKINANCAIKAKCGIY